MAEKDYNIIIRSLLEEIEDKILSTENWIYYFWNIPEIQEYLQDTSNDWEKECTLRVKTISDKYIKVDIEIPGDIIHERILYLDTFETTIKNNVPENSIFNKLKSKRESREYYIGVLKKLDNDIFNLENMLNKTLL